MFKKIIKGYVITLVLFFLLTLLSAVLLRFSSLSENLGFYLILAAMCISCLFFGITAGNAVGKKGLFTGIAASLIILASIFSITLLCFRAQPCAEMVTALYSIPVLAGAIGGIWGTNLLKS